MTDVDFDFVRGVTTVVFGPNGSGKTTLLRRLAQGNGVAYLPQNPYLFRGLMGENLGLGLTEEQCGLAGSHARRFGLGDLLAEPAFVASGGERAKLALARTLARSDPLVLLDEPLAAVDLAQRSVIVTSIRESLLGRTGVIVTHELDQVVALADRMAVMIGGEIVQQGTVDAVLGAPKSEIVARVIGVSNLYEGAVIDRDGAIISVDVGGVTLIGSAEVDPGETARILIPAETVVVAKGWDPTSGGSARNRWNGTVVEIGSIGRLVEVVIDVGVPVRAIVTPGSVDALGISVGSRVSASVKASSVRVVPH